MNFGFPTASQIATNVWSATARSLTTLNGVLSPSQVVNTSLAANATFSISAGSGRSAAITIGMKAGAAGTFVASFTDGVNTVPMTTVAAGATGVLPYAMLNLNVLVALKNNDASNAATYWYASQLQS